MLATIKSAVGELSRVVAVAKLVDLVNSAPKFTLHPKVIDGCSDLETSTGANSLPGRVSSPVAQSRPGGQIRV